MSRSLSQGRRPPPLRRRGRSAWLVPLAAVLIGGALEGADQAESSPEGEGLAAEAPRTVVDSALPIEEHIRRFRETIAGDPPEALIGGATSRDGLVEAFVRAVERADTARLAELIVSRAEFAYLYYPHSEFTRRPYQQSPAFLWFRFSNTTDQGITRVLRRHGGKPLGFRGYACGDEAVRQENNTVWSGCVVRWEEAGQPIERRVFGAILERDGRFKFLTYASDY